MKTLPEMLAYNRAWASEHKRRDPAFFTRQAEGQQPTVLLIGCSDSRVPITNITGSAPGDMFVHRNIANQVHGSDMNIQAVVAYAVDVLGVSDIMVVGHTGCGGVKAATGAPHHGLVDHWLGDITALWNRHRAELARLPDEESRLDRLVGLNVLLQVFRLVLNPTVREAWTSGRSVKLHGFTYVIETGLLTPEVEHVHDLASARAALAAFDPA